MTSLRQRMLEDMQIRNLSPLTPRAYVEHVSRFARHFSRASGGTTAAPHRPVRLCRVHGHASGVDRFRPVRSPRRLPR